MYYPIPRRRFIPILLFLTFSIPIEALCQVACIPFVVDRNYLAIYNDFEGHEMDGWSLVDADGVEVDPLSTGWTIGQEAEVSSLGDPDLKYSQFSLLYSAPSSGVATTLLSPVLELDYIERAWSSFYYKGCQGFDNIEVYALHDGHRTKVFPPIPLPQPYCNLSGQWAEQYIDLSKIKGDDIRLQYVPHVLDAEVLAIDNLNVYDGAPGSRYSSVSLVFLGLVLMMLGVKRIGVGS